jgi:hypothetical protein
VARHLVSRVSDRSASEKDHSDNPGREDLVDLVARTGSTGTRLGPTRRTNAAPWLDMLCSHPAQAD